MNNYLDKSIIVSTPEEHLLGVHITKFRDKVMQAANENYPHYLCNYLYDLAGLFMKFYEACPILKADDNIQMIRPNLDEAVDTCVRAAGQEYDIPRQKQLLKAALQASRSLIHFNVDTWTSKTMAEYQAIVAFFITPDGHRKKALLALPELDAGHSGSECGARFIATIQDYGIERQLGYMTCDNASANNTMCRYIEAELGSRTAPILWRSDWRRCRCLGHIINLCCQAFMSAPDEEAIDHAVQQSQKFAPERVISVDTLFGDVLSDEEDDLLEGAQEGDDSDESSEEQPPRKRARRSTAVSQRTTQSRAKKERRRGGWRLQGPIRTLRRFFVWVKKEPNPRRGKKRSRV